MRKPQLELSHRGRQHGPVHALQVRSPTSLVTQEGGSGKGFFCSHLSTLPHLTVEIEVLQVFGEEQLPTKDLKIVKANFEQNVKISVGRPTKLRKTTRWEEEENRAQPSTATIPPSLLWANRHLLSLRYFLSVRNHLRSPYHTSSLRSDKQTALSSTVLPLNKANPGAAKRSSTLLSPWDGTALCTRKSYKPLCQSKKCCSHTIF